MGKRTSQYTGCSIVEKKGKEVTKGKDEKLTCGPLTQIFQYMWGGYMLWSISFPPWSIEKKFQRPNAHDFSKSRLQIWDCRWLDQKSQIFSWDLTFRSQFFATALLNMYIIIIRNIFRFLLQLIDPQSDDEYELQWGDHAERITWLHSHCYLPLSDIAKLLRIHGISGDIKGIQL